MLRRLSLAMAVVCVVGMCSCVKADVMSRLIVPRDYGVKLCGREFIRAVIYTCGGSRWKRAAGGDSESFQWSSLSDDTAGDSLHSWLSGAELTESRSPPQIVSSHSLADLLALYVATGERRQQQQQQPLERSLPSTLFGEQDGIPGADDWSMVSKKKRNFSAGVAGMCCSQGCTKNDIGRLC